MDEYSNHDEPVDHGRAGEHARDRVAELERELDRKDARIQALERQLSEARELEQLADRLCRALQQRATEGTSQSEAARRSADAGGSGEESDEILLDDLDAGDDGGTADEEPVMTAADALGGDGFTVTPEPTSDPPSGPGHGTDPGSDDAGRSSTAPASPAGDGVEARLRAEIDALSVVEREMLRHYREHGPTAPPAAHQAVGGSGERTAAYAANRALRERGFVEHAARGRHRYALPSRVAEAVADPLATGDGATAADRDRLVQAVEASFVHDVVHPSAEPDPGTSSPGAGEDVGAWPDA